MPPPAPAPDYDRFQTLELAVRAQVIVAGEIVAVGEDSFDFLVEESLFGSEAGAMLRVWQFEDWLCASRWTGYAHGQRLLLFLTRDSEQPILSILGGGDEGEMPLVGDDVLVSGVRDYRIRGAVQGTWPVFGAPFEGSRIPYRMLADTLRDLRSACTWTTTKGSSQLTIGPRDSIEAFQALRRRSHVARHLCDQARSSEGWTGGEAEIAVRPKPEELRALVAGAGGFAGRDPAAPGEPLNGMVLGTSLHQGAAFAGDVDGDGHVDLAVGGKALWILLLDGAGCARAGTEIASGIAGFTAPLNAGARFGRTLASLGDLDGDGVPDLCVGAPGWGGPDAERSGGVFVLFLRRDGSVARHVELGSQALLRAAGVGPHFGLGASLAVLGDLDGDGTLEVAIGREDHAAARRVGPDVLMVSLDKDARVLRVAALAAPDAPPAGNIFPDFGAALAATGDIDGDGVNDLAASERRPWDDGEGLWIVLLRRDATARDHRRISAKEGGFEGILRRASSFARGLAAPGDLDADGVPDLLVDSAQGLWTLLLQRDGGVKSHQRLLPPKGAPWIKPWGQIAATWIDARPRIALGALQGAPDYETSRRWWLSADPEGRLTPWKP